MLRKTFVVGFVSTTVVGMLPKGRFLKYNTKYIIVEQKEGNHEPLLFFGSVDKPLKVNTYGVRQESILQRTIKRIHIIPEFFHLFSMSIPKKITI
jgi:hypothetical protein